MSSCFKSDVTRIKGEKSEAPGPGHYNHIIDNIKKKHKSVGFDTSENKNNIITNKKGAIITSSNRVDVGPCD